MTLMARYSGRCPNCDAWWQPGDLIRAQDYRGDEWPTVWEHATCPNPLAVEHPACPVCFLTHPSGACDREG